MELPVIRKLAITNHSLPIKPLDGINTTETVSMYGGQVKMSIPNSGGNKDATKI